MTEQDEANNRPPFRLWPANLTDAELLTELARTNAETHPLSHWMLAREHEWRKARRGD